MSQPRPTNRSTVRLPPVRTESRDSQVSIGPSSPTAALREKRHSLPRRRGINRGINPPRTNQTSRHQPPRQARTYANFHQVLALVVQAVGGSSPLAHAAILAVRARRSHVSSRSESPTGPLSGHDGRVAQCLVKYPPLLQACPSARRAASWKSPLPRRRLSARNARRSARRSRQRAKRPAVTLLVGSGMSLLLRHGVGHAGLSERRYAESEQRSTHCRFPCSAPLPNLVQRDTPEWRYAHRVGRPCLRHAGWRAPDASVGVGQPRPPLVLSLRAPRRP
jgi:hypothetical protein